MKPQTCMLPVGSVQLHLRYDMNALLKLEQAGCDYLNIFSADVDNLSAYLSAGLIEDIGIQRITAVIAKLGAETVKLYCESAMILALPEYDETVIPDTRYSGNGDGFDFAKLRCMFCDEMGKPDEMFWNSTIREICQRWQIYSELKGYSKPVERMEMFDSEGM